GHGLLEKFNTEFPFLSDDEMPSDSDEQIDSCIGYYFYEEANQAKHGHPGKHRLAESVKGLGLPATSGISKRRRQSTKVARTADPPITGPMEPTNPS
ncbi:MAG: hypothetical protein Q9196_007091, partial [Gyalolechia fulgens]